MTAYETTLKAYFAALDSSDLDSMLSLFSTKATVHSPFLGEVRAVDFFPKVFEAAAATSITVFDILVSIQGQARAVGYFNYDWTLNDGTVVQFNAADVFDFTAEGKIARLTILYDTFPIRDAVGDQYQ